MSFSSEEALLEFSKKISSSVFQFLKEWFSETDFVVVQTSGSTGEPKLIQLKKEFMVNGAKATGAFFNLKENTTALLCLSVDYIAGKMMLIRALTLGWHLDVVEAVANPLEKTTKSYDFSAMVPLQFQNALPKINRIKKIIVGGGVVSGALEKQMQHIKTKVYATYGMTETITHIAVKQLNHLPNKIKASFYHTLPNVTIYKDERNCLLLKAPKVSNDFIVTNDVVSLISDTQFEWLGRFDNVINSGGVKLHPEKIEQKLADIIQERFFVCSMSDEILGEKLILIVEGDEQRYNFKALPHLTKYEIPKAVYFLKEFVVTETKKIQRSKTLDLLGL